MVRSVVRYDDSVSMHEGSIVIRARTDRDGRETLRKRLGRFIEAAADNSGEAHPLLRGGP